MFALDLFNTKYEKELKEGAVDSLEARRIDDLNMKMLDLLDRAKEPAYKKNPAALAGLKKQFQKIKAERDSYFKINPATGMDPTGSLGTTKGKLDEQHDSPVAGAITRRILMQRHDLLKQYGPELVGAAIDNVADYVGDVDEIGSSDVSGWVAQVERMLKENPPEAFAEEKNPYGDYPQSPRAFGAGNFQRIVRANMGNLPSVTLEFPKPKDNINLDKKGLELISDYYDSLENDSLKNHFIYRVLPSADEILTVLKRLGWNNAVQPELPGIPTQGELPLQEKKKFDSKSDVTAGDTKVARELQKLRAQYPAAKSDVEAVAKAEIDSTERSQQQLSAIKGANTEQDRLLQQLIALDKKQGTEIGSLDNENDRLEQQLAHVEKTNAKLAQTIDQIGGQGKASNTSASQSRTIDLLPNAPADAPRRSKIKTQPQPQPQPVAAPTEPKQKFKSKSDAMSQIAQSLSQPTKVQGINSRPAPSIRGNAPAANDDAQQIAVGQNESAEKGQRLHPGDPVVVTAPNEFEGKTGEIYDFSPSGSFVIVDLYNHGKHSMHLSDVAYNDYADQEEENDWYDEGVAEGKKKKKKKSSRSMGGYFFPGYAYYGSGESGEGGGDGGGESINHDAMNEFDASGYDRYSIYLDNYDLEEKFSDLNDAIEAIEEYKRDDPKSRYEDYNVRDLNGKVVWRNEAWQDIQKPGKIQFIPPKTGTSEGVDGQPGDRKFPDPRKPYIKNGKTIGLILPNGKIYPLSKSDTVGDDGLIYHFQDPRAHGQNKNSEQVKEHYFIYEVKYGHPPGAGYFGDQWIQQGQAMQNQQAQAQKPQEDPWTGPAHGSSSEELAMFKAGKKPVSIQRVEDPAWKELVSSGKYPTEIIYQNGKPSSVVIGQPGNEDSVYKVHKLVQTATKYGEAGDFSPYQNPKYHKLVGQLLGYSDSQINSFMSHYFRNKTTEDKSSKSTDPSGQIAIHNQGLEIPIASKYVGDGQFKITVKNKPAIVTVAGFEIDPVEPGKLDSFYLTDVATGKTHHVTNGWNDPVAVAIFNNLRTNQQSALKEIYKQDMAFYDEHEWNGSRPDRLQGLALSGYTAIPANSFVKSHQDMKKVTGRDLSEDVPDKKTWMAEIKAKYPTVKFMQAKMPGAPILAYVDNKVVAEFNFGQPNIQGVAETALNARDPQGDYEAKRKALHDLSLNKAVDQAAVQQRRLDLDREAQSKGVTEVAPPGAKAERMVKHIKKSLSKDGRLSDKDKAIAYATTWKAHNDGKVEEVQTDYQKRRQRERDVDAGRPVKTLPKNPQTDYAKKRAKDRKDMEMGEGLGDHERREFKRQELQHELGHERNNIAIAINGKTWKVVPGKGYADSAEERAYLQGMQRWAEKKSASSGKKWTVYLTGANPTVNELSTEKLSQYKTAAALDAGAADKQGDYDRGDKRFAGIVKATKKQFANDVKKHKPTNEESSTASEAVERAILNRIMVAHTDLLMQFGPDKVMQAAEEVAYNVGDVDEIGTSDVSAYVHQVKQILGA